MGTRNTPGPFNCYAAALPDEEVFTVLGRDPATPATIRFWVEERQRLGKVVTTDDQQRMREALLIADRAHDWREKMIELADGGDPVWRNRATANEDDRPAIRAAPELRWGPDPDEDGKLVQPLSASRICELLDYATCYGEFDENTPNGTQSKYGPDMSTPMNDIRRHAIWIYKKVLGLLPEDAVAPPVEPHVSDNTVSKVAIGLLQIAADMQPFLERHFPDDSATMSFVDRVRGYAAELCLDAPVRSGGRIDPYKEFAAIVQQEKAGTISVEAGVEAKARLIGKHPALGAPYSPETAKPPVVDSAPEDLAHAPEVPHHRFSAFHVTGSYAYARGLEVSPMHLPTALDAMAKSGWHLVAIFGQTDQQHIGFIFKRQTFSAFEMAHGYGGDWVDPEVLKQAMDNSPEMRAYKAGEPFDTARYQKD